jgi:hypothetical protein
MAYTTTERFSLTAADAASALKLNYGDLHTQFATLIPVLALFEATEKGWTGYEYQWAAELRRHARFQFGAETADLGRSAAPQPVVFSAKPCRGRSVLQITGQEIDHLSKGGPEFWAESLDRKMRNVIRDARKRVNGIIHRDGIGVITTCSGSYSGQAAIPVTSVKGMEVGQDIEFRDNDNNYALITNGDTRTIMAISEANTTISISGDDVNLSVTVDATTAVCVVGARSTGTTVYEPMGLGGLISATGSVQGLSRTTYPELQANVWPASGSFNPAATNCISDAFITKAIIHLLRVHGANIADLAIITDEITEEYLLRIYKPAHQWTNLDLRGGHRVGGFIFQGTEIPIVSDYECPAGRLYIVDRGNIHLRYAVPWKWADYDGSILRWESRKDAFLAYAVVEMQMTGDRFDTSAVITGITGMTSITQEIGTAL